MSTFVLEDHNNSTRSEASYYVSQPQESLFSKLLGIGYVMFKVVSSLLKVKARVMYTGNDIVLMCSVGG